MWWLFINVGLFVTTSNLVFLLREFESGTGKIFLVVRKEKSNYCVRSKPIIIQREYKKILNDELQYKHDMNSNMLGTVAVAVQTCKGYQTNSVQNLFSKC